MNKLVWISVAGMLMVHPVQAQSVSTPQPFAQINNLNLSVTNSEAEMIWKGLRKLPVEEVENLMQKLRQQVMEQQKPVDKSEGK